MLIWQELDDEYLVVWEGFPSVPWKYMKEPELREVRAPHTANTSRCSARPICGARTPNNCPTTLARRERSFCYRVCPTATPSRSTRSGFFAIKAGGASSLLCSRATPQSQCSMLGSQVIYVSAWQQSGQRTRAASPHSSRLHSQWTTSSQTRCDANFEHSFATHAVTSVTISCVDHDISLIRTLDGRPSGS